MTHLTSDVLIVGAGGAGMYAAVAAAREGARVLLVDKSLIGRGGATIMAQMTVAAAVGEEEPDHWTHHLTDTLAAGRGLCNETLAAILCKEAPARIREMDGWKAGWARGTNGRMRQVMAPGHQVPRCVYVDFLNTGPAVAKTLRAQVARGDAITRVSGLYVIDLVVRDGHVTGAVALDIETGKAVTIAAGAVVLAGGGLTKLYQRNSASVNMGGDSYALALGAGAELIDMEFPQFFPIGHLSPRLVGMDPIMWDPFRYKLGGRLLNGNHEEFIENYGERDSGKYTAMRDITSYAITKELEAGRGSPAGGAYLSFEHISEDVLRTAFGPVIDRLSDNGINLTNRPIEVAPIAHYHMGGVRVDEQMETRILGLFAAGEAVGGANGANRLSGNAITEAFVFGERAGRHAARSSPAEWKPKDATRSIELIVAQGAHTRVETNAWTGKMWIELQALMWDKVGVLRDKARLKTALARIREMRTEAANKFGRHSGGHFDMEFLDAFDLRSALLTAETVALTALARTESRGAHQREDLPDADPAFERNQIVQLNDNGNPVTDWAEVVRADYSLSPVETVK